ncbi:effector-associated constant component EACC1 [Actinomadura mexicana]|uniref:effector-associated constant component EACC1 n=1 Tax=Actinomadura mexicana TaxID=134959 RepID=UPI001178A903|nr:hypothetical protein [Actinomadura mexicana]
MVDITLWEPPWYLHPYRHEVSVAVNGPRALRMVFEAGNDGIRAWDEWRVNESTGLHLASPWCGFPIESYDRKGFIRALFDGQPGVEFHTEQKQIGIQGPSGPGDVAPLIGNALVAALGAGGVGTVLATALMRFFTRHRGKKIIFRANGKVRSIHGYSAADVERVLNVTQLVMQQRPGQEPDPGLQEQLRQLLSGTDDPGGGEPGSGDGGDSTRN